MFSEQSIFDWLLKGFVGVLTWLGIRLHNRVDALEKNKVSHEALNDMKQLMASHREETQENFKELRSLIIKILQNENS